MEFSPGTTIQNGNYELLQRAGKGGFGSVWRAKHVLLEKIVALKFLESGKTDRLREMLKQEAQKLARLAAFAGGARHIVYINSFFPGDDYLPPFLELEWLDGGSLRDRLSQPQTLQAQDIVFIAVQVLDGLLRAHEMEMIHCDIKPSNVLFSKAENIYKITDFGLARNLGNLTEERVAGGTLPYMSPEQFEASNLLTPATDIYSFGCLIFECCERAVPFSGTDWNDYKRKHTHDEAPALINPSIPAQLRDCVAACLAKDPVARPSAAQIRDELTRLLEKWKDDRFGSPARHAAFRNLIRRQPEPGTPPEVRHRTTGISFQIPPSMPIETEGTATCLYPDRLPCNRDYLHMLREPAYRIWYPSMIAPTAHDGGYLERWFRDQPQSGSENDPLVSLPFQAANDFVMWMGARLPSQEELDRLFKMASSALADQVFSYIRRNDLPFMLFWCRDTANHDPESRTALLYRFPLEGPLSENLRLAKRPSHYCFPYYSFIPVIPAGYINDIAVEGSATAREEPAEDDGPPVTIVEASS